MAGVGALQRLAWAAAMLLACTWPPALHAQDEVPFVVTPDKVTLAMLELARVGPDDFVLDLGSGDGRIVIQAARRFGARGLGVEIVPGLVERSRRDAHSAGVAERARFVVQDLFAADLSVATVVTMYLLQEVNLQLRPALLALAPGTRVVSHDHDMGDWLPDRTVTVDAPDKGVGLDKRSRLHLWLVPARLHGDWCGRDVLRGARLRLAQRYQMVQLELTGGGTVRHGAGRIDGRTLRSGVFDAEFDGQRLKPSPGAAWGGGSFERC